MAARGFGGRNAARSSGVWSGEVSPGGGEARTLLSAPKSARGSVDSDPPASGVPSGSRAGGASAMKAASGSRVFSEFRPKSESIEAGAALGIKSSKAPRAADIGGGCAARSDGEGVANGSKSSGSRLGAADVSREDERRARRWIRRIAEQFSERVGGGDRPAEVGERRGRRESRRAARRRLHRCGTTRRRGR